MTSGIDTSGEVTTQDVTSGEDLTSGYEITSQDVTTGLDITSGQDITTSEITTGSYMFSLVTQYQVMKSLAPKLQLLK